MEKSEEKAKAEEKSVKRLRNSSDENSPTFVQEKKFAKMSIDKTEFEKLMNTVTMMANNMKKLDLLESMNTKIEEIVKSNEEVQKEVKEVKSRVDLLERDVASIAERGSDTTLCDMKRKIFKLEQEQLNSSLIVKNLPKTLCDSQAARNELLLNIFKAIGYNQAPFFTEETNLSRDKNSTVIVIKFVSSAIKNEVIKTFRSVKKDANRNQQLLVENLTTLPVDHPMNGQYVMMMNKLSSHYTQLITFARKYVGSHFEFVYDSPEGNIVVRCLGNFKKVNTEEDVQMLIQEVTDKGEVKFKSTRKKNMQHESKIRTRSQSQLQGTS